MPIITDNLEATFRSLRSGRNSEGRSVIAPPPLPLPVRMPGMAKRATVAGIDVTRFSPDIRSPFMDPNNFFIPTERRENNAWLLYYYTMHPLVGNAIDLHSELPLSRFELTGIADNKIIQWYMDYSDEIELLYKMVMMLKSYWLLGETFIYSYWDDTYGCFTETVCLDPSYLEVYAHPMIQGRGRDNMLVELIPDEILKAVCTDNRPEFALLKQELPAEIVEAVAAGQNIPISNFNLGWMLRKVMDSHVRGTSILMRALKDLMYEDKLKDAQMAVCNGHIHPKWIWKIGEGSGLDKWMPDDAYLESFRALLEAAWRDPVFTLVTHNAVTVDIQGSSGRILNLMPDFEHIDKRILTALFFSKGVAYGEGPTYQTASIATRVLFARYLPVRTMLENVVKNSIFLPVALAQGFYERTEAEMTHHVRTGGPKWKRDAAISAGRDHELSSSGIPMVPDFDWTLKQNLMDDQAMRSAIQQMVTSGRLPMKLFCQALGVDTGLMEKWLEEEEGTPLDKVYQDQRAKPLTMPGAGGLGGGGQKPSALPEEQKKEEKPNEGKTTTSPTVKLPKLPGAQTPGEKTPSEKPEREKVTPSEKTEREKKSPSEMPSQEKKTPSERQDRGSRVRSGFVPFAKIGGSMRARRALSDPKLRAGIIDGLPRWMSQRGNVLAKFRAAKSVNDWQQRMKEMTKTITPKAKDSIIATENKALDMFDAGRQAFIAKVMTVYRERGSMSQDELYALMREQVAKSVEGMGGILEQSIPILMNEASDSAVAKIQGSLKRRMSRRAQLDDAAMRGVIDRGLAYVKTLPDEVMEAVRKELYENHDGKAAQITKKIFDGAGFDEAALEQTLGDLWNDQRYKIQRVIRTQQTNDWARQQLEEYKALGITHVSRVEIDDMLTCKTCRQLIGKIYEINKLLALTFPLTEDPDRPGQWLTHPYCRGGFEPVLNFAEGWTTPTEQFRAVERVESGGLSGESVPVEFVESLADVGRNVDLDADMTFVPDVSTTDAFRDWMMSQKIADGMGERDAQSMTDVEIDAFAGDIVSIETPDGGLLTSGFIMDGGHPAIPALLQFGKQEYAKLGALDLTWVVERWNNLSMPANVLDIELESGITLEHPSRFFSALAEESPEAYFAAACADYVVGPIRLAMLDPEMYAFVRDAVFQGKEFLK